MHQNYKVHMLTVLTGVVEILLSLITRFNSYISPGMTIVVFLHTQKCSGMRAKMVRAIINYEIIVGTVKSHTAGDRGGELNQLALALFRVKVVCFEKARNMALSANHHESSLLPVKYRSYMI